MTDRSATVGVAAVCLFPAIGAMWRAASLRGDTHRKWSQRVNLADAGLTQAAVDEIVALQAHLTGLIGGSGAEFDPAVATIDPAPLIARTDRINLLLKVRNGLASRLRRHCRLGPLLMASVLVYVVGWLLTTLYFLDYALHGMRAEVVGLSIVAVGALCVVGVYIAYAYYENKLASAEILSQPKAPIDNV